MRNFYIGDMVLFEMGVAPVIRITPDKLVLAWCTREIIVAKASCELYDRNNPVHRQKLGLE